MDISGRLPWTLALLMLLEGLFCKCLQWVQAV